MFIFTVITFLNNYLLIFFTNITNIVEVSVRANLKNYSTDIHKVSVNRFSEIRIVS